MIWTKPPLFIKNQLARCEYIMAKGVTCHNFVTRIFLTGVIIKLKSKFLCEHHFQRIKGAAIENQYYVLREVRI